MSSKLKPGLNDFYPTKCGAKLMKIPKDGHDKITVEGSTSDYVKNKKKNKSAGEVCHNMGVVNRLKNVSNFTFKNMKAQKEALIEATPAKSHGYIIRKKVDPGTANFFHAIAQSLENKSMDSDEFSAICGSALEETKGKELELATDVIISGTLQTVLEGCELDQLCHFLLNCAHEFPLMALDKLGSYVAETALKSLAVHVQDKESFYVIGDTLSKICEVMAGDSFNLMCSSYGSHALRCLLCLCKGVPLDSIDKFQGLKPTARLAERINKKALKSNDNVNDLQNGFEDIFRSLIRGLFNHSKDKISILRNDKYGSFVLQTALKLLGGNDVELFHAISVLLGCQEEDVRTGKFVSTEVKHDIMLLLEDTASSHLLEAIIEVRQDAIYNELLNEVFKGSFFQISMHHCGNFVVQALISSARTENQLDLIWRELSPKFKQLLEAGKLGVVICLLAACQRLETHSNECCQGLIASLNLPAEFLSCLVPTLLFIDRYLDRPSWEWFPDTKMNTLGCLMLQIIFRYPKDLIKPYITSIMSMEADHILLTAKDAGGGHVLEAFLCSSASVKQKLTLISRLRNHFGELAKHASGSFIVEKCFAAGDLALKEAIAEELAAVQSELSQTKHGPFLLRKTDINGYMTRPKQWRSSHESKANSLREYEAEFGSKSNDRKRDASAVGSFVNSKKNKKQKKPGNEADSCTAANGIGGWGDSNTRRKDAKFVRNSPSTAFLRNSGRRNPHSTAAANTRRGEAAKVEKRVSAASELANLAGKSSLSRDDVQKLFKGTI